MKKLILIICICLGCMPLVSDAQKCNWKSKISSFYLKDSCTTTYPVINGRVVVSPTTNITYSWKILTTNGWIGYYNGPNFWLYPGSNGTYTISMTLTDTARKCDTTIYRAISFNCMVYTNGNYFSKYRYEWKINGTVVNDTTGLLYYPVNANGTYVMCVKVADTVNNCDTTICKTFNVTCVTNCNWKGRSPALNAWDSCYKPTKTNEIWAGISFNGVYSGKYPCEWTVNGVPISGSGSFIQHTVNSNGTYTVCVKVRDTAKNCDTTFCRTVVVNCIPCGKFKGLISTFYLKDTCDKSSKTQNRFDGVVGWVSMSGSG
jgi:hypothetical protein